MKVNLRRTESGRLDRIEFGERFWIDVPEFDAEVRWKVFGGHGGDEYGNCSYYLKLPLIGGFTYFPRRDFQREVEIPSDHIDDSGFVHPATAADWWLWYDVKFGGLTKDEAEELRRGRN